MSSYCHFIAGLSPQEHPEHRHYHDHLYGFPIADDNELFGRLLLEINQAGLSWSTILKKEQNFRKAYHHFDIQQIAAYTTKDEQRLLNNAGIIRNRLKVAAAIYNAQVVASIQQEFGSFQQWLQHHHPLPKEGWVKLFKAKFRFTGGEIVNEFLMSAGYLPGAHPPHCAVYARVLAANPPWLQTLA